MRYTWGDWPRILLHVLLVQPRLGLESFKEAMD